MGRKEGVGQSTHHSLLPPPAPEPQSPLALGHLHQLLQDAARLPETPHQLLYARVPHAVVAQVQLPKAAVGQQSRGKGAAATVTHVALA